MVGRAGVVARLGPTEEARPLASVTKLLTALTILVACEEGSVALDDPAGPPGSTLRHLLAHASGCSPDDPSRLVAPPATRRIYSNAGFELAAAHLEARSGLDFADYLSGAVLRPLAMAGARLAGSPAHGALGSVEDLLALASELLDPSLVARETLLAARTVAFPGLAGVLPGFGREDPCDWGLGFELADGKDPHWTGRLRSASTFGHFGQSGTFLWVDPAAGFACALAAERPFGPWARDAWPPFSDAVSAELARRPGRPDAAELARRPGRPDAAE